MYLDSIEQKLRQLVKTISSYTTSFATLLSAENIKTRENGNTTQACFFHPGNQVFVYHSYIFASLNIMDYLYNRKAFLDNLCMNRASLDRVS